MRTSASRAAGGLGLTPVGLKPGVTHVHFRVGKGYVARVVATDESEWLIDGSFGQYATTGEIDPQIQRGGHAAGFGEPDD